MNRLATDIADIDECPMCGNEDFETTNKEGFFKHICPDCCYEWVENV
jgi:transposase-like protein